MPVKDKGKGHDHLGSVVVRPTRAVRSQESLRARQRALESPPLRDQLCHAFLGWLGILPLEKKSCSFVVVFVVDQDLGKLRPCPGSEQFRIQILQELARVKGQPVRGVLAALRHCGLDLSSMEHQLSEPRLGFFDLSLASCRVL